jgi:hypothetical protein
MAKRPTTILGEQIDESYAGNGLINDANDNLETYIDPAFFEFDTASGVEGRIKISASAIGALELDLTDTYAITGDVTVTDGGSGLSVVNFNDLDSAISGINVQVDFKDSVRVATTAPGTLASSFENGDTIDGVVLVTGDRILIKNQASGAENGVYTVNASGAPTRSTDADTDAEVTAMMTVPVSEGTANLDTYWMLTTNDPIVLDTTSLVFSNFISIGGLIEQANYVVNEDVTRNTSTEYQLANTPETGTVAVYLRGVRQNEGADYTISGDLITFSTSVTVSSAVIADYIIQ